MAKKLNDESGCLLWGGIPVNKCACGHHAFKHLNVHLGDDKWGVACTECECREYRPVESAMNRKPMTDAVQ